VKRPLRLLFLVPLVGILGYCGTLQVAEKDARADADAVAAALKKHSGASGSYPANLAEIGFDANTLRDKWHLSYRVADGKPYLFYSAQNNWLVAYHYDFAAGTWQSQD
jgi:hypothetical protein